MSCVEIVGVLKDIVITGCAVTGAVVAVQGLRSWKVQLRGKSTYELAKGLLGELYKYRDAVRTVRNPFISSHEFETPEGEVPADPNSNAGRHQGKVGAYMARWRGVQESRARFYPEIIESKVLWGDEFEGLMKPLFELENKLFRAVQDELRATNPELPSADREWLFKEGKSQERHELLYGVPGNESDQFEVGMSRGFEECAKYLQAHLKT